MSELGNALEALARAVGGARAAVVIEAAGIDVATWGGIDFETAAAELAELWRQTRAGEVGVAPGDIRAVEVLGSEGGWVLVPLGSEYVLALLTGTQVPPGKARFYATEWARRRWEDFS